MIDFIHDLIFGRKNRMARININGIDIVGGRSISIRNNEVRVDGELVQVEGISRNNEIKIVVVEGTIERLETDADVTCETVAGDVHAGGSVVVNESVEGNVASDGSVSCGDIQGDVRAGGSVSCDNVGGDVKAEGSVSCGDIHGDVEADGSVSCDSVRGGVRVR